MAKKAAAKGKRKSPKKKVRGFEPRPSYENLLNELKALTGSLGRVLKAGRDEKGKLGPVQTAQALSAMQALQGAKVSIKCPQLFGPYMSKQG